MLELFVQKSYYLSFQLFVNLCVCKCAIKIYFGYETAVAGVKAGVQISDITYRFCTCTISPCNVSPIHQTNGLDVSYNVLMVFKYY